MQKKIEEDKQLVLEAIMVFLYQKDLIDEFLKFLIEFKKLEAA